MRSVTAGSKPDGLLVTISVLPQTPGITSVDLHRRAAILATRLHPACERTYSRDYRVTPNAGRTDMASSVLDAPSSGWAKLRSALTPSEWWRLGSMLAVIIALHLIGWITLVLVVQPAQFSVGGKAFGIGVGLTAYTLGMRHAFDADHIAAIDNTTRKLMNDGQRPLAVGFFFSLGHSTVVFGLAVLLSLGIKAIVGPVEDDSSMLHHYTGLIGTSVSGVFLYLIAILNVIILVGILRAFVRLRRGDYNEAELQRQLDNRGLVNRVLGRVTK